MRWNASDVEAHGHLVATAVDDLTVLWMDSDDRDSIRRAADAVDRILIENPSTKGSHVREGLRQLISYPLVVQFSVEEDDRTVTFWSVKIASDGPV
jgi:hypothetical protein